jgi:hypothetical protein
MTATLASLSGVNALFPNDPWPEHRPWQAVYGACMLLGRVSQWLNLCDFFCECWDDVLWGPDRSYRSDRDIRSTISCGTGLLTVPGARVAPLSCDRICFSPSQGWGQYALVALSCDRIRFSPSQGWGQRHQRAWRAHGVKCSTEIYFRQTIFDNVLATAREKKWLAEMFDPLVPVIMSVPKQDFACLRMPWSRDLGASSHGGIPSPRNNHRLGLNPHTLLSFTICTIWAWLSYIEQNWLRHRRATEALTLDVLKEAGRGREPRTVSRGVAPPSTCHSTDSLQASIKSFNEHAFRKSKMCHL